MDGNLKEMTDSEERTKTDVTVWQDRLAETSTRLRKIRLCDEVRDPAVCVAAALRDGFESTSWRGRDKRFLACTKCVLAMVTEENERSKRNVLEEANYQRKAAEDRMVVLEDEMYELQEIKDRCKEAIEWETRLCCAACGEMVERNEDGVHQQCECR